MKDAESPANAQGVTNARPGEPLRCDLCGAPAFERHCKIICGRCGYTRDCSDP